MMTNKRLILTGQFALVLSILGFAGNFLYLHNQPVLTGLSGLMLGLSLVMNVTWLVRTGK